MWALHWALYHLQMLLRILNLATKDSVILHAFMLQSMGSTKDNSIRMWTLTLIHKDKGNILNETICNNKISKLEDRWSTY